MTKKIDISSTILEKGFDSARAFLSKLISPAIEQTGLLIKDQVTLWRLKNQIRVLNKANKYCEKKGISPKRISLKLLVPLIEKSGLEDDDQMQDKWAILLSNLVDSNQNIRNHVFPYILSQISLNEFNFLNKVIEKRSKQLNHLLDEIEKLKTKHSLKSIQEELNFVNNEIEKKEINSSITEKNKQELIAKKIKLEFALLDIEAMKNEFEKLKSSRISFSSELENFELYNLLRLGLVDSITHSYSAPEQVEIPYISEGAIEFSIQVKIDSSRKSYFISDLGEIFIKACSEKSEYN